MPTLRFAVFDQHGPAADFPVESCYALGPDDEPLPLRVEFRDGELRLTMSGSSAAVAAPVSAEPGGGVMHQTTLLPPRERPYDLLVELARHRIKMFIVKCEDWQMFDLDREHPAMRLWDEARGLFTRALVADEPVAAARWALASLERGTEATDRLAMAHADILLHRRFAARAASSSTLGTVVWPGREGKTLRELIAANFDVVVLPLCWRELEVREGMYEWGPLDRWMEWAAAEKKPIVAGPLIDLAPNAMPEWMHVWRNDYETLRDMVYDHAEKVVQRYAGRVGMWSLAAGVNLNDGFRWTEPQMIDLVRMIRLLVRQYRRNARIMIEIDRPFGGFAARNPGAVAPMRFIDRLIQEGVAADAIGVRLVFGRAQDADHEPRDIMQVSHLLDRLLPLDLPVVVSAMGVPAGEGDAGAQRQSRWLSRIFPIALSKPFVESVFWCDLYDHPGALYPGTGLIDEKGRPRPALTRLVGMRRRLRKPLGVLPASEGEPVRADL